MKYKAALAQITPVLGDVQKNLVKHLTYIDRACAEGASLVVFPELSLTGYTLRDLTSAVALRPDDSMLDPLRERSERCTIICGGVEEDNRFGLYNSAFIFDRGTVSTHRKIYPPDYSIFEEGRYFLDGKKVTCTDTSVGRLGVHVCEDLWHISVPLLAAMDGAECIVAIAASPTRLAPGETVTNYAINSENHRVYARLLQSYILFVNRTGFEDGVNFWGGSELVNPFGEVVAAAPVFHETMIYAEMDTGVLRRARQQARHFLDEKPELMLSELQRILRK